MADIPDGAQKIPDFRVVVEQSLAGVADADSFIKGSKWLSSTLLGFLGSALQLILSLWGFLVAQVLRLIFAGVEKADPAFGEIAKASIQGLFGVSVPASSLTQLSNTGGREGLKRDVGKAMLSALGGAAAATGTGEIEPSTEPAEKYLGTIADFAIEGWLIGIMVEAESLGYLKEFGELKDTVGEMFGFGRLTRRILNPFINTAIVEPARRAVNLAHRPNLLSAGDVVRQLTRGRWSRDRAMRELSVDGWSDERIEALINGQVKFHSVADLTLFVRAGLWTNDQAIQHLRDQGFEEATAADELLVEQIRFDEGYAMQQANAAVDAYVVGRIDESELRGVIADAGVPTVHRPRLHDLAVLRRELRKKSVSPAEAEACVKANILSVVDYRHALERDGYDDDAIIAKELLLRWELDKSKAIDAHRAELDAQRATEKAAKQAAAEAKRAEVEASRAAQRRGSIADLQRAVVRGVIPIARLEEVLAVDYDGETVGILVSLVEQDRQAYLTQQQRAADATQRAAIRGISLSQVEQAVLSGVLTLDQYRAQLEFNAYPAADVAVLVATLGARLEDLARAKAKRDAAGGAAAKKSIDLARFEQLVRRGVRTLPQYDQLLQDLGFDDPSRADIVELLQLKIADDAAAATARADAEAKLQARGLSLEQFRRAAILGLKTADDYQQFLQQQGFTADVQALLLTELRDDVATADAARARRDAAAGPVEGAALSLSTVARAARLGIVSPDTYQGRLVDAGYSADDIAIEMQLLLVEIADTQAARAQRDQVTAALGEKGIGLADLAKAVRRGLAALDDYRARALAIGLTADAADTLTRVLADELRETTAAKARRAAIDTDLSARNLSLAELEAHVLDGSWTVDEFTAALLQTGYEADDAELLAFLLLDQLGG